MQTSIAKQCTSRDLLIQTAHFHYRGMQLQFRPTELLLGRYERYDVSYSSKNYYFDAEMTHY